MFRPGAKLAGGASGYLYDVAKVTGAICGVLTLGILGLILGPVIFAILITVWRDVLKNDTGLNRMPVAEL
jgi:predicted PurR-regulated permease PerM